MSKEVEKKVAAAKAKAIQKAKDDAKYGAVINPKSYVDHKKEDFMDETKGKLPFDREKAWEWVKANRK